MNSVAQAALRDRVSTSRWGCNVVLVGLLLAATVGFFPPVASASHTWNVSSGVPRHWQKYGTGPSDAPLLDKTTGVWPGYVASAVSTWNSGTTTVDFSRTVSSGCGTLPNGYATVCNANYTDSCGSAGPDSWAGCTDSLLVNSQNGHWGSAVVRFDDTIPGFTWTDAKRQEVTCHELGHVLGLWHDQTSGCLETVTTGNYTAPVAHDHEQANANHNHTDCIPPCQGRGEGVMVAGESIPITVNELLLSDLGTPPFLMEFVGH